MTRTTATVLVILLAFVRAAQAAEVCGNSIDDDGNGLTDETCYPTATTGVCESPLSCEETGMVSWTTGSLHYDLPPDIAPAVPYGPGIGLRRFYTSQYSPGTNPTSVNKTPMGPQWQHTYMTWIYGYTVGSIKHAILHTAQGRDVHYTNTSIVGGWELYTPQAGEHVLSFKHNTVSPFQYQIQLLTGETLVYSTVGQLTEIWDTLAPTPNKVLIVWDSTTNGNVLRVTSANNKRRLVFNYTSGLLTSVDYQYANSIGWITAHTTTYNYTSGTLTSVTIGGALAQQYSYAGTPSRLTQISDATGNLIAAFSYDAATAGKVVRVKTPRGTVGFEYQATRSGCTGTDKTILYFNQGNSNACSDDASCGSGFMCGGKTGGTGATGQCFLAARCMTTATVSGESVVTNVSPLGPGGGACSGACTDVLQYVWTGVNGAAPVIDLIGRQDPLGDYTSIVYNNNGLPTQITYGDTDSNASNGGGNRTMYIQYDGTFPGRINSTWRQSDLNQLTTCTPYDERTDCDYSVYCYGNCDVTCNADNQLCKVTQGGQTLDTNGTTVTYTNTYKYVHDLKGRVSEIDGAIAGIKTAFTYLDSDTDGRRNGFLGNYQMYTDATHYVQPFVLAYDSFGHPTALKAPDGNLTCDTYDPARGYLASRRRAMVGQTDCSTIDATDLTMSWVRDSALRLTQLRRPDDSCVFYTYDTTGRALQIKRRDDCVATSAGDYQQFSYTADSQVSEVDTYNAAGTLTAKQPYTYFASRRLQNIVNPVDTSKFTGIVYDSAGKVTEIDGASSLSKTVYHFDGAAGRDSRVTSEQRYKDATNSDTWSLLYAWQGGQSEVIDGDSKATQSVRDDLGRVVKLVSPDMAGPTVRVYDAASRLTTVVEVQGGGVNQQTHTFYYDFLNRQTAADYQGSCPVNPGGEVFPEIFRSYDTLPGLPCPMAGGCNNLSGRLAYIKVTLACSSLYASSDGALDQETFYSYDRAGRIVEEYIRDDSGRTADHVYSWTKNGALTQVTMPSTTVIGWSFDSAGNNSDKDLITSIYRTSTATKIIENVAWHPFGPLKYYLQENKGSGGSNHQTTINRNLAYRPTSVVVDTATGSVVTRTTITEDSKGRVTKRTYIPTTQTTSSFFYDFEDRVTCETAGSFSSCQASGNKNKHDLSVPFTNAGDWKHLLRPIPGTNPVGYVHDFNTSGTSYGTSHQVTDINQSDGSPAFGHTAFGYDARGFRSFDDNITTLTNDRRDYTYDARHNLVNVRGQYKTGGVWHFYDVASAFDAKNRRVFKSFTDETTGTANQAQWFFYYDALDRLTEVRYTPDISVSATYSSFQLIWVGDRPILYWQTDYPSITTSKRYVSTDETNRPIDMVCWGANGCSHVWQINPSGWGVDTNLIGPTVYQPLLFSGQYQDTETTTYLNDGLTMHRPGIAVNGYRSYDPFDGAYLQVDPAAAMTWSPYQYSASDPVGKSDRLGLMDDRGPTISCEEACWYIPDPACVETCRAGGGDGPWCHDTPSCWPDDDSGFPPTLPPEPEPCSAAEAHMVSVCSSQCDDPSRPGEPRRAASALGVIDSSVQVASARVRSSLMSGALVGTMSGTASTYQTHVHIPNQTICQQYPNLCVVQACSCLGGQEVPVAECNRCTAQCGTCYDAYRSYDSCLEHYLPD